MAAYLEQVMQLHAGLALATAGSAFLNAGLLFHTLKKERIYEPRPGWARLILVVALASLAMGGLLALMAADVGSWLVMGWFERGWRLLMWVGIGMAVYLGVLMLGGIRPRQLLH